MLSVILFKYALLALAALGLLQSHFVLKINRGDLATILSEKVNGPKKLSTELRINQSSYLLAVFCVLFLMGVVQAINPILDMDYFLRPADFVARVVLWMICVLLIAKQRAVRKHRGKLDSYYDEQTVAMHVHRRSTDLAAVRSAQDAAGASQAAATIAQDAATLAQDEATDAQNTATKVAKATEKGEQPRGEKR